MPITVSSLVFFEPDCFTLQEVAAPGVEVYCYEYDRGAQIAVLAAFLVKK
jgi:hypothetical protein